MEHQLQLFSENLLHMMRGALLMLYLVMCVGLFSGRKQNPIQNYLFWLLVTLSVSLLISFAFMFEGLRNNELFRDSKTLLDFCLIPLIGSFLLKVMLPECINWRKTLLMLLPAIGFMTIHAFTRQKLMLTLTFVYSAVVAVLIFVFVIYVSVRYDRFLKNNFSNIDDRSVGWVRQVIYLFAAWYVAWSFIASCNSDWLRSGYYVFLIAVWAFIYRHSVRHIATVETGELFEQPQPAKTAEEDKPAHSSSEYKAMLEHYMGEKRLWLNPSLTLSELAELLDTNRTYLSEYISKTQGTNFYYYLNGFRVRHACEMLVSEPALSIQEVGERSGFNAFSTFRRTFEKTMGCSPAAYRKQQAANLN